MGNKTFDQWILGAAGLVAVLVAASVLTFRNTRSMHEEAGRVAHSHAIVDTLEEVIGHMREAEAAQRTHLITGGDDPPTEFAAGIDAATQKIVRVKGLTAADPDRQARISDVERRVRELAALWSDTIRVRREQGFDAARRIVDAGQSRQAMTDLKGSVRQIYDAERAVLKQRSQRLEQAYVTALVTGVLSGVAAVAGVLAFTVLLRRHLAARTADALAIARLMDRKRMLVDNTPLAVIEWDANYVVTRWSGQAERLFGWAAAEVVGRRIDALGLIYPEDVPKVEAVMAGLARPENKFVISHNRNSTKAGGVVSCEWYNSVLHDEAGRMAAVLSLVLDVTERDRAEADLRASELQFHTMADNISQLAWMARPDGHVFWYNRRWYEYTGSTPEQMEGWGWQSVHDPAEVGRVVGKIKAHFASGEPWEDTFPLRRHDGRFRWHLSRMMPVRDADGRIVLWFGTNTDITERRELERALREADRNKDEFLGVSAHELRNLLAPLRNGLHLVKLARNDCHAVEQARTMMERQVGQMVRLLDDLMDLTRISQGKVALQKTRTPVAAAVRNAVETSRPLVEQRGHDLTLAVPDEPIFVDGDEARLSQVFANLLNNAAKYTDRGGRIRLAVERQGSDVVVTVEDNGAGIPAHMLPRVFDMFTQVDRTLEKAQGGLGIGLNVVERLVEMHGGSIVAESGGPGKGSKFVVRLPAVPPPASDEPHEDADVRPAPAAASSSWTTNGTGGDQPGRDADPDGQ